MDDSRPHVQAAISYLRDKGYSGKLKPKQVDKVYGEDCWYMLFELWDGELELECEWRDGRWHWRTTMFRAR